MIGGKCFFFIRWGFVSGSYESYELESELLKGGHIGVIIGNTGSLDYYYISFTFARFGTKFLNLPVSRGLVSSDLGGS